MISCGGYDTGKYVPYKSYKNEQFNKKLDKARGLLNSIDDTSLRAEDKKLLKDKIKELFSV